MEKSKVYFTDMRALPGTSLLTKLQRLIRKAGIGDIDMKERFVAIKIHFGEPGNLSYLRPNFAKAVVDVVKEQGESPFSPTATPCMWGGGKMRWIIWKRRGRTASPPIPADVP